MSTPASGSLPPLDVSYEDDPRVVEQAATEDYSLHIVPRTWRMDRGPLTMAWYAVMTAFFYLYFAAFLALTYGTVNGGPPPAAGSPCSRGRSSPWRPRRSSAARSSSGTPS